MELQHSQFGVIRAEEHDGTIWFCAKDVCAALELKEVSKHVEKLDDDEKGTKVFRTLEGPQKMMVINESGLYTLILRSNKPKARAFRKWVTSEVLPTIRRTGRYELQRNGMVLATDDPIAWVNGVLAVKVRYLIDNGIISLRSYEHQVAGGKLERLNRAARCTPAWVSVKSLTERYRYRLAMELKQQYPHLVVEQGKLLYLTAPGRS